MILIIMIFSLFSNNAGAKMSTINAHQFSFQTIDGETSITLESPFAAVELVYVAADLWRVF